MSREYHLAELANALDPSHPRHILPPPLPRSEKVLDVGCGAGQSLIAAYPDRVSYGADIDFDALQQGTTLTTRVCFCQGQAELLPFKSHQFDFVFSRVALPLTNTGVALNEIHRVLKPGGGFWATVHTPAMRWKRAKAAGIKGKCFFVYITLNSVLFHWVQRQFSVFGRYESFQTERGMRRALERIGFGDIEMNKRGEFFVVTARAARP